MVVSGLTADDGNELLSFFASFAECSVGSIHMLRDYVSCWCGPDGFDNVQIKAGTCLEILTADIIGYRFRYDKNVSSWDDGFDPSFNEEMLDLSCQVLLITAI